MAIATDSTRMAIRLTKYNVVGGVTGEPVAGVKLLRENKNWRTINTLITTILTTPTRMAYRRFLKMAGSLK